MSCAALALALGMFVVPIAMGVLTPDQSCPSVDDMMDYSQCLNLAPVT